MKYSVFGVDIAKHVIQLHTVDPDTGEVERYKLKRGQVLEFFAQRSSALIAIKTEVQQSVLALHRIRAQLMKFRIMQTNALRGLLYEFGVILPEGHTALLKALPQALVDLEAKLPDMLIQSLREQWRRVEQMQDDIDQIERRLAAVLRDTPQCQSIAEIPGVGLLTATAAVATMGQASAFKSGREFAAWAGLVPKQRGTGGHVRQLGLSKRGDVYLRTLLMHGARAIVMRHRGVPWVAALLARRPYNVAVAAVANKLARTI